MGEKKTALIITTLSAVFIACIVFLNTDTVSAKKINLCTGDTYQLKAGKDIKVKISNPAIVRHLKKGKIRALKSGKCTVKVIKGKKVKKYSFVIKNKTGKKKNTKGNMNHAVSGVSNVLNPLVQEQNTQNQNEQNQITPAPDIKNPNIQQPDVTAPPVDNGGNDVVLGRPPHELFYYYAETPEAMLQWMNSPEAKTVQDGVYKNIVELYTGIGFVYAPVFRSLNMGIRKVEVGSKYSFMSFYLSGDGNRVSINPLSEDEMEQCNNSGGIPFLMEKENIKLNENQNIYQVFDGVEQDTVIGTKCWTEDSILVDGKETRCLMRTDKYNTGTEWCQKIFIYDRFVVYISTYYANDGDSDIMESVSFEKIQMQG